MMGLDSRVRGNDEKEKIDFDSMQSESLAIAPLVDPSCGCFSK